MVKRGKENAGVLVGLWSVGESPRWKLRLNNELRDRSTISHDEMKEAQAAVLLNVAE